MRIYLDVGRTGPTKDKQNEGHREKKSERTRATEKRPREVTGGAAGTDERKNITMVVVAGDEIGRGCGEEERKRAVPKIYILGSLGIFAGSHSGIYSGGVLNWWCGGRAAAIRE